MTIQFDFAEPSNSSNQATLFGLADADVSPDLNAAGAKFAFSLNNGSIARNDNTTYTSGTGVGVGSGKYAVDTSYTMTMLYNRSGSAVIDYVGTQDLANNSVDLWITPRGSGAPTFIGNFTSTSSDAADKFLFRNFSAVTANTLYIDNFSIDDTIVAPIPEPSATILGAFGTLLLLRRKRA